MLQLGMHLTQVSTIGCCRDWRPPASEACAGRHLRSIGDAGRLAPGEPSPLARLAAETPQDKRQARYSDIAARLGPLATTRSWGNLSQVHTQLYHYRKCPVRINSPLVSVIAIDGLEPLIWRGFLGVVLPLK